MAEVFDFQLLAKDGLPVASVAAGERLFVEGDDADCMYVVRSGSVRLHVASAIVETVGPNGVFGEMALIDGSPRSATAIAAEASEVSPIDGAAFRQLVQEQPEFVLRMMQLLSQRLRRMNQSL